MGQDDWDICGLDVAWGRENLAGGLALCSMFFNPH